MDEITESKEYEEGKKAGLDGKFRSANPYTTYHPRLPDTKWAKWNAGWEEGRYIAINKE